MMSSRNPTRLDADERAVKAARRAARNVTEYPGDILVDSDEGTLARYYLPVVPEDLTSIESLLETRRSFCAGFSGSEEALEHPYRVVTYRHQLARFGTECRLLLDRNIVTRLVALSTRSRDANEQDRLAAAVLCFAQCAGLVIDPGLALHQFAAHEGGAAAISETTPIQVLDNVRPQHLADIALGHRSRLAVREQRRARGIARSLQHPPVALERLVQPLRDFRTNYTILLRIAALSLSHRTSTEKAAALLDWVHREYRWSPSAVWFGLRYFATNLPAAGWLRGLRTPDRRRAIARVKNVAWDLTVVTTWLNRRSEQQTHNAVWILCSLDRAVIEIADAVALPDASDTEDGDDHALHMLQAFYGPKDGTRIYGHYSELVTRRQDPERAYNRLRGQFPSDLRSQLELAVIQAVPGASPTDS